MGHLTQLVYNDFGELTEEILPDPDGAGPLASPVLHWSYDSDGNEVGYIDADGNQYTDVYNNRNERTEEIEPSPDGVAPPPTWQWQYNAARELTETIDPMGRVWAAQNVSLRSPAAGSGSVPARCHRLARWSFTLAGRRKGDKSQY